MFDTEEEHEQLRRKVDICREGFIYLQSMGLILTKDVRKAESMKLGKGDDKSIKTRALIRALFAVIECYIFAMKRLALQVAEFEGGFSQSELSMLREENYDLDEKGNPKIQPKFIPLPRNLRFAFEMCSRALGVKNTLNVGDDRWDSFQKALQMRHSITHPRTVEDLQFTDADYNQIERATLWFTDNFNALGTEFNTKIEEMNARLDELRKQLMS